MRTIKINGKETKVPENAIAICTDNGQWVYDEDTLISIQRPTALLRPCYTDADVQSLTVAR